MAHTKDPAGDRIESRYANAFRIGYNAYEFVLDFGECYAGQDERIHTRIVTNPSYAKGLSELLDESLDQHQERYKAGAKGE